MEKIIFLLLVTVFVIKAEYSGNDLSMTFIDDDLISTVTNASCKQQGVLCDCSDLSTIYYCTKVGTNSFKVTKLGDCSGDTPACLETATNYCAAVNPNCGPAVDYNMDCVLANTDGFFPDPFDCKKYHVCALTSSNAGNRSFVNNRMQCDDGYGYNASSTFCSIKLSNNLCTGTPIPLCPSLGYTNSVPSNPTIYYICVMNTDSKSSKTVKYIPQMNICAYGDSYSTTKGCPRVSELECGDYDNIPYIFNNTVFYNCSDKNNPELENCPTNQKFNITTLTCSS